MLSGLFFSLRNILVLAYEDKGIKLIWNADQKNGICDCGVACAIIGGVFRYKSDKHSLNIPHGDKKNQIIA
jgi:hypothetical protein